MNNDSNTNTNTNPFPHTQKAMAEFHVRMRSLKQKLEKLNRALEAANQAFNPEPPK